MSKLIESLKASTKEFSKTTHQMTQEQLADIYFSGSDKVKKSEYPMVIKVVEKQRASSLIPWIIASVAFLLMALSLFSTKRIFVDIKVVDEHMLSSMQNLSGESRAETAGVTSKPATDGQMAYGDKIPMQFFDFEGAAKLNSSKDKANLTLVNSSVAPFARATLRFKAPMNLNGSKIVFYAKGQRGGENVAFALKDRDNIQAFHKGKVYPFPSGLSTDWQRAEVPVLGAAKEFDPTHVASMRFDFGSKDTENKPGDTVLIRDIQIVPL